MPTVIKYKFDDYEADVRAAELRRGGNRLKLQMQPFQVLVALLERPREVVTREELRQRLWPQDTFVDFDHGLNTAMVKLRDVLGDSANNPRYVETIAKRGYRFLGIAEAVLDQATPVASAPKPALEPAVSVPAKPPTSPEQTAAQTEPESGLPHASRNTARLLFALSQIMYVIFYLSALFSLENLYHASYMAWGRAGTSAFVVYLTTSLVGLVVRLYLISATAMDYHLLGGKYRVLTPGLFVLDMLWALSPLLLAERMPLGFALAACAALLYMPFAQRTLMQMMQQKNILAKG